MLKSLRFRLNGKLVEIEGREEQPVLDWLRDDAGLTGTREGCREGDCGACLALLGRRNLEGTGIEWVPAATCLLALGELDGRTLITVEGLAGEGPTPVMKALHVENASQCGFCSPGVTVALSHFLLAEGPRDEAAAVASVEGNLCRCTGYASIGRAARALSSDFSGLPLDFPTRLAALAARGVFPPALAATMQELPEPASPATAAPGSPPSGGSPSLGGGTDWYVRNTDPAPGLSPRFVGRDPELRFIETRGSGGGATLALGAGVTVADFFASKAVRAVAPGIERFEALVASPHIRARATLAGNIANASPVADLTAMLLALDARLVLSGTSDARELPLAEFFLGYKKTVLDGDAIIETILLPAAPRAFSFEKAARRERLDIAAVNTALSLAVDSGGAMRGVIVSAGGVGPVPLLLGTAAAALEGRKPSAPAFREAMEAARAEVAPISDVRGSAEFRKRVLGRLMAAHALRLFPGAFSAEELLA
ncbi:MAG: FAD binding domain-containing protein [Spirochaetales bacterium]|nr:FAD binding domain-containing protein [Spirochaetales bacterium]